MTLALHNRRQSTEEGIHMHVEEHEITQVQVSGADISGPATFETPFPFYREVTAEFGLGWRIGCAQQPGDCRYFADGVGAQIVEVIDVVAVGHGYAPRVFYLRSWRDPHSKCFSRQPNPLMVGTAGQVKKLIEGYRHPYELRPQPRRTQLRLVSSSG
jgi:hypothetical protein